MKKLQKIIKGIVILTIISTCLTGCGSSKENKATATDAQEKVDELQTEQDYRDAIKSLGTDQEALKTKLEYYDVLWQMDVFTQVDFDELSQVYEALGDMDGKRETLIRKHTYYPSEENIEQINNVVLIKDSSDNNMAALMNETLTYLEDKSSDNVKVQIESLEWQNDMQDNLVGVTKKINYSGDGYIAQVESDKYSTTIFVLKDDNTIIYYKTSGAGVVWANALWDGDGYTGDYSIRYYDNAGSIIKECKGTFDNGISIGDYEICLGEDTYKGEFSADGITMVEQLEDVNNQGGVIYAYDESGNGYVYEEKVDKATFVIDYIYLGLPLYEPW